NGKIYIPIFKLLCGQGADITLCNYKGKTPLYTLFQSYNNNTPINPITISLLLTYGAKTIDINNTRNTPLYTIYSSIKFSSNTISLLLQHKANPTLQNSK
ncbi:hypothetical protein IWW34DRAFT_630099, partial [Fusarium oxysporum f. sp. albedinis]